MPIEKTPAHPLPITFRPAGGVPRKVKTGDSFVSIAKEAGLDVWRLIEFNFGTRNPAEVNWYLRRNVGCKKPTADGKNWTFTSDANPGLIFMPPKGPRINYTVPGVIMPLAQPTSMTCWATVGTMMMSWHDEMSYTIPGAMGKCGSKWLAMFNNPIPAQQGLPADDHDEFAAACGMRTEPFMCFPADSWERMMRDHGPLAVVTANPYHARIMVGISGDGTGTGTTVDIVDPNGGRRYTMQFDAFTQAFEAVSASPRAQIWHY